MANETHAFTIPVGDWSDDGHGKCEYFHATAAKPFKDVCLAFEAAKKKFKKEKFTPEELCCDYGDSEVPEETVAMLAKHGYKIDPEDFSVDDMANLVVWFLNQGDPELNVVLDEKSAPPMLRNWDYRDAIKKDLGSFGYGLLGD